MITMDPVVDVEEVAIEPAVRKVIVIDDELVGLTYSHLVDQTDNIEAIFGDATSPEFDELWTLVCRIKDFPTLAEYGASEALKYATTDEFVRDVILSKYFIEHATGQLIEPLTPFIERSKVVAKLLSQLHSAFPAPHFETTFRASRPSTFTSLLEYDLLVFDLVLKGSAGAVDELISYLKNLADSSVEQPLPCIIVMSSRDELIAERLRFSTGSSISAAGLLLLPKKEVERDDFGASGLILSYQQLDQQREVAQLMRAFMTEWMAALDRARDSAKAALWNLDAAAMQEIHLSAFNDNDPYDEHLNEFMAREYMWHVESASGVTTAIKSLDQCFQKQFKITGGPAMIKQRFIAPFVNQKPGRDIISHFTWTGFSVPDALSGLTPEDAIGRFNRLVPFGALLAPDVLSPETECLVHITQQCDLNGSTRPGGKSSSTAVFAIVNPILVEDGKIPTHSTDELVARGLNFGGREYDFKLAKGQQLALGIPKFITYVHSEKINVVGRLRHDIATHFLIATANHMTRPASMKTIRTEVRTVRLYLYGENFPNDKILPYFKPGSTDENIVQVVKNNKIYYFQSDSSMRIALWLKDSLAHFYPTQDIDAAYTCNILSTGVCNKATVVKLVDLNFETVATHQLRTKFPPGNVVANKVLLLMIEQPQT